MKHKLLFFFALMASLSAEASETINGVCYDLDATTHTATVVKSTYSGVLNIPATVEVDGDDTPYTVTKIGGEACYNCTALVSVIMPNTIEEIGIAAFKGCTNLKTLTLPSNLKTIKNAAFQNCTKLKTLVFPDNVETIHLGALTGCSALESISFGSNWNLPDNNHGYYCNFSGCTSLKSITVDENHPYFKDIDNKFLVTKQGIGKPAYPSGYTNYNANELIATVALDELNLPAGIEYLATGSLTHCTANTIYLPEGIIEDYGATNREYVYFLIYPTTFTGSANTNGAARLVVKLSESDIIDNHFVFNKASKNLTGYIGFEQEITLPADYNGAKYQIADGALQKYNNFHTVTLSDGVKGIGKNSFYLCENLESVNIGANVTSIGEKAFYDCQKLETVSFAENSKLSTINASVFECCFLLKNINLPNSLTQIGESAFASCYLALESITIPNGVTAINKFTFSCCRALKEVTIPESVVYIGDGAFSSCEVLKSVTLPSGLIMLGESAFRRCYSLNSINIPESIEEIPNYCFTETAFTEFNIPKGVNKIGTQAFWECKKLGKLTLPSTMQEIGDQAFCGTRKLFEINNHSDLVLTAGSEDYGEIAFYARRVLNHKQLETVGDFLFDKSTKSLALYTGTNPDVELPETYQGGNYDIMPGAFWDNQTVENVTMSDHVTAIGKNGFIGCKNLKSVELSQNLHAIGASCFQECSSLKEIHLPQLVTEIPEQAFYLCSSLEKISYGDQITKIGPKAFHETKIFYVIVPETVTDVHDWSFLGPTVIVNYSNTTLKTDWTQTLINQRAAAVVVRNYWNDPQAPITADLTKTDFIESVQAKITHPNAIVSITGMMDAELPFNYVAVTKRTLDNRSTGWDAPRLTLTDGDYFSSHFSANVAEMNYKRNFTETGWQALYLPYELKYEDWKDVADVATFESATDNADGSVSLNCKTVTSGSIAANTPCLIRPKQEGELTLTSHDVNITETQDDGSLSPVLLFSNKYAFKFWGNYQPKTDMYAEQYYALSNGLFCQAANSSVTLNPFRIYLSVTERSTGVAVTINPSEPQKAPRVVVDGLDDNATGIANLHSSPAAEDAYYDLSGRRVLNPSAGIYVKNGKKVVIK